MEVALLGVTAVVDQDPGDIFLPDKVWRLEVGPKASVIEEDILGSLRSAETMAYIRHNASGAAAVRNISKARLLEHSILVPPIDVQQQFAALTYAITEQRTAAQRAIVTEDELFASLQSRAFRGEL